MRKLGYSVALLLLPLLLAGVPPVLAESPAEPQVDETGTITAINAVSRDIRIGQQNFLLANDVIVHGIGKERVGLSALESGMDIRFRLQGTAAAPGKTGVISEIWPILK